MLTGTVGLDAIQEFSVLRSDYASGTACGLLSFSFAASEISTIPRGLRRMGSVKSFMKDHERL